MGNNFKQLCVLFALRFCKAHRLFEEGYRVSPLRNTALITPYMHNGVYNTLEEVVDFYNRGGGDLGLSVPGQTLSTEQLNLSEEEKKALVAFLKSLAGR